MKSYYYYKNQKYCIDDNKINNNYLKNYNKEHLINSFYNISRKIYNNKNQIQFYYNFYLFDENYKYLLLHKKPIIPTQLIRLSYYSLLYGGSKNNFVNHNIENDKNILYLLDNNLCGNIDTYKNNISGMLHSIGQDQFWCQRENNELLNFSRNYDILENTEFLNKNIIFNDMVGMDYDDFNEAILGLLLIYISVENQQKAFKCAISLNKNIYKLIQYYTFDIKKETSGYETLIYKPFVKINNKYILTNIYSLFKCFSNSAYWIIRNYYNKNGSNKFVTEFGNSAECHIQSLFDSYLYDKYDYFKIKETKNKTCDWRLETKNYIILIEQKTYIEPIKLKTLNFNTADFKSYMCKYEKAIEQLNETEKKENNKTGKEIIKIILHYDELYFQSIILRYFFNLKNEDIYMLNMDEFEKIIYCLSNNEELFDSIIKDISYGYKNYDGKDIEIILNNKNIKNDYFINIKNHINKIRDKIISNIKDEV